MGVCVRACWRFITMNYTVHAVMYGYYGAMAAKVCLVPPPWSGVVHRAVTFCTWSVLLQPNDTRHPNHKQKNVTPHKLARRSAYSCRELGSGKRIAARWTGEVGARLGRP